MKPMPRDPLQGILIVAAVVGAVVGMMLLSLFCVWLDGVLSPTPRGQQDKDLVLSAIERHAKMQQEDSAYLRVANPLRPERR